MRPHRERRDSHRGLGHRAGIPVEALPRVFDRFFRVDPSRSQTSVAQGWAGDRAEHPDASRGSAEIASQLGRELASGYACRPRNAMTKR